MTPRERFSGRCKDLGIELDEARFDAAWIYFELLVKWNRRINLTGFSFDGDTDLAVDRLLIEPLSVARIARTARLVLDVGSGGGSPAIPFFLGLDGASELVLVESRMKKVVFLREALRSTGIQGRVVADRFEQLVVQEPFDTITVRAVAPDTALWSLVRRALAPGGRLFWFHSASQPQPDQDVVSWGSSIQLASGGESCVSVGTSHQMAPVADKSR